MKSYLAILLLWIQFSTFAMAQNPGLTAVFDSRRNNVSIKWQHTDDDVAQYVLQRSGDNYTWSEIFKNDADHLAKNKITKFTDQKPDAGKSYYRLKVIRPGNNITYSSSILVIIGKPGNSWIMYPVPVTTMLNLQYNGSELIPGVITVYIRTMKGQILNRLRLASTTRLIQMPVDNLGRGAYDIQIIIKDEVVWNQRFIK